MGAMKIVLRIVSVLCFAIAAFLLFAVIAALASDEGARAGVAIGYVIGSAVLIAGGVAMWRSTARAGAA
jgi:peptidoglycan/LPS O-acetylase OafA/YrhL